MSSYFATEDRIAQIGSGVAIAAGSTSVFPVGKPADVKRIIVVVTTAQTTAGAVATVAVRNADNTGSVTKATFTIPVSAVNTVLKADVAAAYTALQLNGGTGISQVSGVTTGRVIGNQTSLPGVIRVNPGQELTVTIAAGGAAGVGDIYVEYNEEGNNLDRFNPTDMPVTLS